MNWKQKYLPEAEKDLKDLDGTQRILVLKAIKKVQQNPLSHTRPNGNSSIETTKDHYAIPSLEQKKAAMEI